MPKAPTLHPYSDRASFDRLMLLIAAIAQNPGIGAPSAGVDAMKQLLGAMHQLDAECPEWSPATLRKDVRFLLEQGILPRIPNADKRRHGYHIGVPSPPIPKQPKRSCGRRKSKLPDDEIRRLKQQGESYAKIADLANISRARVGQICNQD